MKQDQLTVGLAQMAPIWLDRAATTAKMIGYVERAARSGCQLLVFGEALCPGYPFWLEWSGGARFNDTMQKTMYAHYLDQAVVPAAGHLDAFCSAARDNRIALVLGVVERATDRGGHSLYCSLVFIGPDGTPGRVHRKLMPTYEERLVWGQGDGYGLRTWPLGAFTLGALNCWENWMPLPRAALYGMGEDLHVALWPGNLRNTELLTRAMALEGRSYVLSVSGLFGHADIPEGAPFRDRLLEQMPDGLADGGSCIAGPDGNWVLEPVTGREDLLVATLDHARVRAERQNFDPAGHYARPDVLQLRLRSDRQSSILLDEADAGA
jgi:nitrilase